MKNTKKSWVGAMVLLVALLSAPGRAKAQDWSLDEAQAVTAKLLRFKKEARALGSFSDREGSARLFDEAERILNEGIPGGPHRVERLELLQREVVVHARLAGSDKPLVLLATAVLEAQPQPKRGERVVYGEILGLSIYEIGTYDSADGLKFSQVTQTRDGSFLAGEAGVRAGKFTFSVFSRRIGAALVQNGAAVTIPVMSVGGFELNARLEAAHAVDTKIQIVEGAVKTTHENAFNTSLRLEATRKFAATGVTVGGGVKFLFNGSAGIDQEPLKIAFLRLTRQFRDRAGREVASAQLLATHELGKESGRWMVAFVVGLRF